MLESFSHKLNIYEPIEFTLQIFNKRVRIYSKLMNQLQFIQLVVQENGIRR